MIRILTGDALAMLRTLESESVQVCVTSPPYFALRDYGVAGQLGLEATPAEFVARLVAVFDEVKRVLRRDGLVFCNLGDSYSGSVKGNVPGPNSVVGHRWRGSGEQLKPTPSGGIPAKNLLLIPERFAIAMQDAGWYVRSRIAWCKKSAMPESVKDRPSSAWEHIFMFSKSPRYFYDQEAVRGIGGDEAVQRLSSASSNHLLLPPQRSPESPSASMSFLQRSANAPLEIECGISPEGTRLLEDAAGQGGNESFLEIGEGGGGSSARQPEAPNPQAGYSNDANWFGLGSDPSRAQPRVPLLRGDGLAADTGSRHPDQQGRSSQPRERGAVLPSVQQPEERQATGANLRNFWLLGPEPYNAAHFAVFPSEIPRRCILAGSRPGDVVLDPFLGAGTTLRVASRLDRDGVGIELNPEYVRLAEERIRGDCPMFAEVTA